MSEEISKNKPVWQIESTHPELAESLREALREIIDPEIGLNIIQLGLVRDLQIDEGGALVRMMLTTPFCPYGPAMLETTRDKVEAVLQKPTHIELLMEMWDFSYMEEDAAQSWGFY